MGIEYIFAEYHNNSYTYYGNRNYPNLPYDTVFVTIKYKFKHKLVSIPIKLSLFVGKNHKWLCSVILNPGWLVDYKINNYDLDKLYQVFIVGAAFGRKILDTPKIDFIIACQVNYTSQIGSKSYVKSIDTSYLQSKPHHLILPTISLNLNYKL